MQKLDEQIGMCEDPEEIAREQLRAFQESRGMQFEDAGGEAEYEVEL